MGQNDPNYLLLTLEIFPPIFKPKKEKNGDEKTGNKIFQPSKHLIHHTFVPFSMNKNILLHDIIKLF